MPSQDLVVKIPFIGKDNVSREIHKMSGSMRRFGDTSRSIFRRMRGDALSAKKVIGGILGAQVISAGVSELKNQVGNVLDELVKFDDAAVKASARYGFDRNAKEFEMIGKAARETGAATKFTAAEAAQAIDAFAMSNFRLEDSMRLVPTTANLAMAADLDLADSAKIAATSLAMFGKEATEFSSVADVLAFTANSTKTDLAEMFETLRAGGATKMGSSVETFSAFARAMGDFGIVGSKAGTAIKTGLLRMTTGSAEAGKELKKLGVKYYEVIGGKKESRDAIDIISDLEKKFSKMGSADVSKSMTRIFGLESLVGMEKVFKSGSSKLRQFKKEAEDARGYVDKTSEKMGLSYGAKLAAINSAIVEAGFKIIDKYGDEIPTALDFVIEKIRNLDVKKIHSAIDRGIKLSSKVLELIKESIPYLKTVAVLWAGFRVTSGLKTAVSSFNDIRQSVFLLNRGISPTTANIKNLNSELGKVNKRGVKGLTNGISAANVKALGLLDTLSMAAAVGYTAYTVADEAFKARDEKLDKQSRAAEQAKRDISWERINKLGSMEEASKAMEELKWAQYNASMGSGLSRANVADAIGAFFTGQESNMSKQEKLAEEFKAKRAAAEKIWNTYADAAETAQLEGDAEYMLKKISGEVNLNNKVQVETTVKIEGNVPGVTATAQSKPKTAPLIDRQALGMN